MIQFYFIHKDVDEAFEDFTKDPLWKRYVKMGLSLEDKKKDFYFSHNYARNELSKLGWKPEDKITVDKFNKTIAKLLYEDYYRAVKNIPFNVFLEYLAKMKNKPLDKLTLEDVKDGIGFLSVERAIPLHVVMSYLPEENVE